MAQSKRITMALVGCGQHRRKPTLGESVGVLAASAAAPIDHFSETLATKRFERRPDINTAPAP